MNIIIKYILLLQCLNLIQYAHTTMPVYCLGSLNTSDCKSAPREVFSYYKPGSRCELEVWRGCPTTNKFDTEEDCSNTCIFTNIDTAKKVPAEKLDAKCLPSEVLTDCSVKLYHVYKYDQLLKDCVEVEMSCALPNVFEEKLECIETCVRELTWEEKLKLASDKQIKELDSILETLLNLTINDDTGPDSEGNSTKSDDKSSDTASTSTLTNTYDGDKVTGTDQALKLVGTDDNSTKSDQENTTDVQEKDKNSATQSTIETEEPTTRKRGTHPMVEIA